MPEDHQPPPCPATSPGLDVPCQRDRRHAPVIAHCASGQLEDGTRWTLQWWNPREHDGADRPWNPREDVDVELPRPPRRGPGVLRVPLQGSWAPPRGRRYLT